MLQRNILNRALAALIIIFLISTKILSQNNLIHFEHISMEEGLPTNSINCVSQDRKGFIWIGTDRGLARYDGYNFKIYRHKRNDNFTLSDDMVTSILEDSVGNFWIGTRQGGLNKFDRFLNKFTCYKHAANDKNSIADNNITSLIESKGIVWAGTHSGLSSLNTGDNKFTNYLISDSIYSGRPILYSSNSGVRHSEILKIIKDKDILWIGTSGGLTEFNIRNNTLSSYIIDGRGKGSIISLIREDEYNLLISSNEGLYRFNKTTKQFQQLLQEPVNDLIKTRDSKLWCASGGAGIILYDIQKGTKSILNKESSFSNGVVSDRYQSIFRDSAGSIWFSSPDAGINLLNPVYKQFNIFSHNGQNKNSLSSNFVNKGFTDKDNTIWFPTTGGGLDKYTAENKSFLHLKESSLKEDKINSVWRDDFGRLWVGTNDGMYNLRFNSTAFEKITFTSYLIKDRPVNAITEDREGNLWFGVDDNLVRYSPQKDETFMIHLKHDSTAASYNFKISGMLNDMDNLWVSTSNGLYKYDIKKNYLILYRDTDPYEVENQFQTIVQDWEGFIWVGSREGGLKSFNPQTGTFITYKIENGLPSNNILSILEDADGYLWLGTDKGLVNFNNKNGSVILYTISDGIPSNRFIANSCWVSPSGEFFFGTINGVFSFLPSNIISNKYIPPVVLSSFKIFNKEAALNYEIPYTTKLEIPYNQNEISFTVSALNYINPERNQYAYMLEGFSSNWTYIKSSREISFTNLNPGTYKLIIKASNNDGKWNDTCLEIKLTIIPPWYRAWWAYLILLIIIISVYLGLRKYELNKVHAKNKLGLKRLESEILQEAEKVKSNFFGRVSSELKSPLSIMTENITKLKKRLNDPGDKKTLDIIEQNSRNLYRQINQLIGFSELEAGSMKLQVSRNDLIPFLRGIVLNFEPAAKAKNIELTLHSPMDHLNIYFDPEKIERILNNLVSNAIKYTPERGSIIVIVELRSERLYIKVKDNGNGIAADKLDHLFNIYDKTTRGTVKDKGGLGLGLTITKKLVNLHKGDIQAMSTPGMGSTFTFWINTNEKVYHYSEVTEVQNVNLTFRPLSKGHEISSALQDQSEKNIVFVIENNPEMRRLIASQLDENYAVYEYPTGAEGFDKAKETIPDIIIFDLVNSGMEGIDFCKTIKNDESTSHIPIILLGDTITPDNNIVGGESGAEAYLAKPFNKLELLMKIKNLIFVKRKTREILSKELLSGIKSDIKLSKADKSFINKIMFIIEKNYTYLDFNIEQICNHTGMSQTALRRKMNALFNKTPLEFILKFRLYKALKLIEGGKTGAEASNAVGFENLSYFSKCYRAEFGKLPPESGN
jgi:signal transduction histidine kinase/ligand-binding sensor domain-containing protein/AraC-like DNA-binding protein